MNIQQAYALILFLGLLFGIAGVILALLGLAWNLLAPTNSLVSFTTGVMLIVLYQQFHTRLSEQSESEPERIRVNQI